MRYSRRAAGVVLATGVAALLSWIVLRPPGVAAAGGLGAWWAGMVPLVAALAVAWTLWMPEARVPATDAGAVVIALALAELFNYGARFSPTAPRAGVYASVPAIQELQRQQGDGRILAVTRRAHWRLDGVLDAVLPPNSAMMYGLRSVQGYDSLSTARYRAYAHAMEGAQPSPIANGNLVLLENVDSPLLDRAAAGLVMSSRPLLKEHLEIIWTDGHVRIYRNRRAMPRAYLPARTVPVDSGGEALDALRQLRPGVPPAPFLQGLRPAESRARGELLQRPALEAVPIAADEPNSVAMRLPTPASGWAHVLVLADAAYPGWRCSVDGAQRPVLMADYLFRAVELSEGATHVRFVYFPQSFLVGAFLACLGAAILSATFACAAMRRRPRRRGGEQ